MKKTRPINYVDLTARISNGRSKKFETIKLKGFVIKGTESEIKRCNIVKVKFLKRHLKAYKKVKSFPLENITITEVDYKVSLGYGVK